MKKRFFSLITKLLTLCIALSAISPSLIYANAETETSVCAYKQTTENGTSENEDFVDYILSKLELSEEEVTITYYTNGSVDVVVKMDDGSFRIYSPLTQDQYEQKVNELTPQPYLVGEAIWYAVVMIYNIASTAGEVISWACKVIESTGNGDPCGAITKQVLDGIANGSTVKFSVEEILYKDPACPYPPNSEACSRYPYAYTETIVKPYR